MWWYRVSRIFHLASYICERTLQELDALNYLPSMIAASAVYLARKNCSRPPWVSPSHDTVSGILGRRI
jgi:hypothetical protein